MVKETKCPSCGSPLVTENGWLDQVVKPLPATVMRCTNSRTDICSYKKWVRKSEEVNS